MINFLVSSLLSVCLLSPVQSPDCAGGIGVSVPPLPAPISSTPVTIQLPVPLPLPPAPNSPVQIITPPMPAPLPIPQPVHPLPAPVPVQPLPAPAPVIVAPAPVPDPVVPVEPPVDAAAPAPVVEAPPAAPEPEPAATYDALVVLETTDSDVEAVPVAPDTASTQRPGWLDGPFNDGSVGAAIGNTVLQFPDFGILLLVILGIGVAMLTEGLDRNPKMETKSDLYD